MDKREEIKGLLSAQGLMPLFYHADAETCISTMQALYKGGIRLIEFTNRGEAALNNFKSLKKIASAELKDLYLGIGTIKNESSAQKFIDAGADFLVSPALAEEVYDVSYQEKILWIPGCMTPTEILKAEEFGIDIVKLFPGNLLGPGFVSAVKELFPEMKFMATGGVDGSIENLKSWFKSGVTAVGIGSKLINSQVLDSGEFRSLEEKAGNILDNIQSVKKELSAS